MTQSRIMSKIKNDSIENLLYLMANSISDPKQDSYCNRYMARRKVRSNLTLKVTKRRKSSGGGRRPAAPVPPKVVETIVDENNFMKLSDMRTRASFAVEESVPPKKPASANSLRKADSCCM